LRSKTSKSQRVLASAETLKLTLIERRWINKMANEINKRIEEYLTLFEGIKARTGDERSAVVILQEVNKDLRMAQIREERASNGNGNSQKEDAPATQKQRDYLRRLGVNAPAELTKKEASGLIDEALAKESEEDFSPAPYADANITIPWQAAAW